MRKQNGGLRKRCGCGRRVWPKCLHAWHLNFKWKGVHHRLSLDREVGRSITSKSEAMAEADRMRSAIRSGEFPRPVPSPVASIVAPLSFERFATIWEERRGTQLVRPRDNAYRLKTIEAFVLPGTSPPLTFGAKPLGGDHNR
jgi:hypothetical protein